MSFANLGGFRLVPVLMGLTLLFSGCGRHKAPVKTPPILQPPAVSSQPPQPGKPIEPPAAQSPAQPEATVPAPTPDPAVSSLEVPGPLIRIGLRTDAKAIRISSEGDFYLTEKTPEAARRLVRGEIQVRVEQDTGGTTTVYRIQVAAFTKYDLAADLKSRLSELYTEPVLIHENPPADLCQVRVGAFTSKEEAQPVLKKLAGSGFPDAFMIKESIEENRQAGITLALRGPDNLFVLSSSGFLLQPSSLAAFLSIDGKPYRGVFEINLNKSGRITVINQLGIEEYLLGVVPAEISPTTYPEFAALAAQSIAARTYAMYHKERNRFRSDGFDLTDDTRTQVYGGVSIEKKATSDAVRQTTGLAIYYQDKVIDAMFMSTCGGRTEDFANIYDSAPVPYLTSVICAIDSGSEKNESILRGWHDLEQPYLADDGVTANRNLELARALGLLRDSSEMSHEFLSGAAQKQDLVRWVDAARKVARKSAAAPAAPPELQTRAGFLRYAAAAFFGTDEIERRISAGDIDYYMSNLKDGNAVPESSRRILSYLIQQGLWSPYSDNTVRPDEPVRRGDAISLLLRWTESSRPEILRKGTFVSAASGRTIKIKWGYRTQDFALGDSLYLFRLDPGRTTPVASLNAIGNEKLSFHVNPQGTIDFIEMELSPTGAASDRFSPMASWDTTIKKAAVAEKLRGLASNIGELKDLKPHRVGSSGRAVQIQVVGSRNSVVVNGYKLRNALNLNDIPFSITRDLNPDESIASFTFHGRGWGHGVGLCQTGAYGMARAGLTYETILKTYYQGVQIRKAY